MLLQGIPILFLLYTSNQIHYILISGILGSDTAVVYPAFLAAIADDKTVNQRAESIGVSDYVGVRAVLLVAFYPILTDAYGIDITIIRISFYCLFSHNNSIKDE